MAEDKAISFYMNSLQQKYPQDLGLEQDYHIFIYLCIKYFFYNTDGTPFDPSAVSEFVTDGANDGGIDAIFNDPSSDANDIIVMQCKYYENTDLHDEDVAAELYKITKTLKDLKENKIHDYNEKLVSAYRNATSQLADDGEIKIRFCTSFKPADKRERHKIEKGPKSVFTLYDFEMNFRDDIEAAIDQTENGKLCVDYDHLDIDEKNNFLKYEDSIIVNISALSLQNLQNRRRNGLLGMNLRYYVRQKNVDSGIDNTIKKDPNDFWYKNNGIVIVCDNYELDGKEVKLWDFSIVNGGQTTNRIGKADIEKDFYLPCKIVRKKGKTQQESDIFVNKIAEATNSQKPIKVADLKANQPEQNRLKVQLYQKGVYYITKKGDKAPKQYSEPYQIASMEQIGKLGLAGITLMPGSARSNPKRMFTDEYYYTIFNEKNAGILADLLKISSYYTDFKKTEIKGKGYDEDTIVPMLKNGHTWQMSCISFLCKLRANVFDYSMVSQNITNTDELKKVIKKTDGMDSLMKKSVQDEQKILFDIFSFIGEEVLGFCYGNACEKAEGGEGIVASDYLKRDTNFYQDIIKRLWRTYCDGGKFELHNLMDQLFV